MAKTKKPKLTTAQILMGEHLRELAGETGHLISVDYEFAFLATRRFRFDLFVHFPKMANCGIEIDGGMWSGGHRHKKAIELDYEKSNLAQVNGFRILRFTNEQVNSGYAKEWVKQWVL